MKLSIEKPSFTCLRITPDPSARNWRTEDIARSIADSFKLPIDRVSRDGKSVSYESANKFAYEMVFGNSTVRFYFHVPKALENVYLRRLQSVWPDATIEEDHTKVIPLDVDRCAVHELVYKHHDMYSLHTDAKDNAPLQSLLEAGRLLAGNEYAEDGKTILRHGETGTVFCLFEPIHQPTWRNEMEITWQKLREQGKVPKKWDNFSFRNIAMTTAVGVANGLKEVVTTVSDLVGSSGDNMFKDKPIDPLASQYAMEQLTQSTRRKASAPSIRTYIWAVVQAKNEPKRDDLKRAETISRALASAFGDLSADNELQAHLLTSAKKKAVIDSMHTKKLPVLPVGKNVFSVAEVGKLIQIPGRELQEKYSEVAALDNREVEVDKAVTKGGLLLGSISYRGQKQTVYLPLTADKKTWDEGCLPSVAIGGMGQGKSTFGANVIVQFVMGGFGALAIDPAKGGIYEDVSKCLPKEKIIRIQLGDKPFSLDFRETKHSTKSKTRLANRLVSFFNDNTDETGGQTKRFIKAAAHAMQGDKLREILTIFEDKEYRADAISKMPDGLHKSTLKEFHSYEDRRQRQILSPIYNRFETILGDEYLVECFECDEGLDMVELLQERKAIIIDVPKGVVGQEALDVIVNLLSAKIDLAMTMRPEENQFPFAVVLDEPAQFLKSADLWKEAAVQSRKWRVKYVWLFHEWVQLPSDLRKIIKSALPHLHLYASSRDIFADLRDEIYPFTPEDGIRLKRFHTINVIRADNRVVTPFIGYMNDPTRAKEVKQ